MWNSTTVSQLLCIEYPIIQGPFGGRFSSTKLTATVSNLGGMGSFGLNSFAPDEILDVDQEIKQLTNKPYALNLWVPLKEDPADDFTQHDFEELKKLYEPYFDKLNVPMANSFNKSSHNFEKQVEAILEARPPVASFIFGIPSQEIIKALKARDTIIMAVATSVEEAVEIENAGIDIVIASGMQAGGHRASFLKPAEDSLHSTSDLVLKVREKVTIPIIAAGGITTGKDVANVLALGAAAAQLGTAFLATKESNASDIHKSKLLSEKPFETALTKVFSGRLARAINNSFIQENSAYAPYPIQSSFLSLLRTSAKAQNSTDFEAFWAGQPSAVLKHHEAAKLFKSLIEEVDKLA